MVKIPYNLPNETKEQTAKMERCVAKAMKGKYLTKKYKDPKQKKAHAIAICKSAIMGVKAAKEIISLAKWTNAFINDLPDSSFAFIEKGGKKDETGKTVPRNLRHLPYKDANGKIDLSHLRNALARLPQTKISDEAKNIARRKLIAAAKRAGVGKYSAENENEGEKMEETKSEEEKDVKEEDNSNELTEEEKEFTDEEMEKIEKELKIDDVELEIKEDVEEKEDKPNEESSVEEESKEEKELVDEKIDDNKKNEEEEKKTEDKPEEDESKKDEESSKEKTDEVVEEKKDEEKSTEEVEEKNESNTDNSEEKKEESEKTEETSEESVEKPPEEIVDEKKELSKELITEIRNELSKAYKDLKDNSETMVKLQKEVDELKTQNKTLEDVKIKLSQKVDNYVKKETEEKRVEFEKKIQLLSDDYKKIGQNKPVEDLRNLNIETVTELENVVKVALQAQDSSVVIPSQAMNEKIMPKREEEKIELSKADNHDFFTHVCNEMETQRKSGKIKIEV